MPFAGAGWRNLRDAVHYERFRSFIAAEQASPALRARALIIAESWIEVLGGALAQELDRPAADPAVVALAALLIAAMGVRKRELSSAMLERAGARTVERRVRAVVDETFARLAPAFADVDRPR